MPLAIILQPEAASKLHTSSTRLPPPLSSNSSGLENDALATTRCGGTGGASTRGPTGVAEAGAGDKGVDLGGRGGPAGPGGGPGGGRWCSGDKMSLEGELLMQVLLGWMGGGDSRRKSGSSCRDRTDRGGSGGGWCWCWCW